ncbi:hypothetical protein Tco_0587020, partial [Tanacetum coccineum]
LSSWTKDVGVASSDDDQNVKGKQEGESGVYRALQELCPGYLRTGTKNYGCGYFDWKDAFDERLMVSSSSTSEGSSGPYRSEQPQPSYSPGPYRSAQPQSSYSSGPHRSVQPQPSYSSGPCRSEPIECSNCKVKDLTINRLESRNRALKARLRMLEARLEMERNPEDHACQSGAILNELLDDMEDLHME